MWIYSTSGFFSVTRTKDNPRMMQIRARKQHDLIELTDRCKPLRRAKVIETPEADYRWRIIVTPKAAELAIAQIAREIDYDNFKGRIAETPTQRDKLPMLHDTWQAAFDYQHDPGWQESEAEVIDHSWPWHAEDENAEIPLIRIEPNPETHWPPPGKTYEGPEWNYEPCEAQTGFVTVGEAPRASWWCADLAGTTRRCVRVRQHGREFFLDDEDGTGSAKVFRFGGGPETHHRSLPVDDPDSFTPDP